MYVLAVSFLPVRTTFSALTTTTKSPASTCGVNVGLILPRKTLAARTATLPSTWLLASITYQRGFCSSFFAKNVLMNFLSGCVRRCKLTEPYHHVNVNFTAHFWHETSLSICSRVLLALY